jgi:prefoldin subunit 5
MSYTKRLLKIHSATNKAIKVITDMEKQLTKQIEELDKLADEVNQEINELHDTRDVILHKRQENAEILSRISSIIRGE